MAYYIDSDIVTDTTLCNSVTHCFLIRRPQAAIASYYKLDQAVTLPEIGMEAQWHVYSHLVDSGIKPIVIQAETIRKDPRAAAQSWWNRIDLVSKDSAFEWDEKTPQDWEQVKGWHKKTMQSTSFHPWTEQEVKHETDRFEAAAMLAPHLRSYLEHHEVFYNRLKSESL